MSEPEKSKYKLKGSKVQGQVVNEVRLSKTRVLVLDGDSVELSDNEYERLSKKYVLHKTSGPPRNSGDSQTEETPEQSPVELGEIQREGGEL